MVFIIIFAIYRIFGFGVSGNEQQVFGITAYPLKGSAVFIFAGILIAFAGSRPVYYIAGCLFLLFYYKDLALLGLPIFSASILIHKIFSDRTDEKIPHTTWIFPLLVTGIAFPFMYKSAFQMPGNFGVLTPYWIIAVKGLVFLGIACLLIRKIRLASNIKRLREARLFEICSIFLLLSYTFGCLISTNFVQINLFTPLHLNLIDKTAYILVGVQYFLQVLLFGFVIKDYVEEYLSKQKKMNNIIL
ncbi:MAG: hypothetical protein HQL26_10425 [Candidatus Omnitrophica bacterium]|nr:hypothetical protein [Candidatus Omnitrophota bacterium]